MVCGSEAREESGKATFQALSKNALPRQARVGVPTVSPGGDAVKEVKLMSARELISELNRAARPASKLSLFFSHGWWIRLKSPTTSHAPETIAGTSSISMTKSSVSEWSEGAYTFVIVRGVPDEAQEK